MKREAVGHTKMKRLCRRLDIPLWQAIGLLESLWLLTGREAPQGDIGKLSDEDIALAIDYRGDESSMIEALVASGWIDRSPEYRLVIHDWPDHADDAVHMRLARAHAYFAGGRAPKVTRLSGKDRENAQKFYACATSMSTPRSQKEPSSAPPEPEPVPEPEPEPDIKTFSSPAAPEEKPAPPVREIAGGLSKQALDESHDRWYRVYWKHSNKSDSRRAYEKLVRELLKFGSFRSLESIEIYLSQLARSDQAKTERTPDWEWRQNLHPATWLNGKRWEDEPQKPDARGRGSPGQNTKTKNQRAMEMFEEQYGGILTDDEPDFEGSARQAFDLEVFPQR